MWQACNGSFVPAPEPPIFIYASPVSFSSAAPGMIAFYLEHILSPAGRWEYNHRPFAFPITNRPPPVRCFNAGRLRQFRRYKLKIETT
jgi:hypothetical protein